VLPTLRRVLTIGALIICGLLLIYSTSRVSSNYAMFDFRGGLFNAGLAILHGHSPYQAQFLAHQTAIMQSGGIARGETTATAFSIPVYPAFANLLIVPLSLLPFTVAAVLFTLASVAAMVGGIWRLGVRYWPTDAGPGPKWDDETLAFPRRSTPPITDATLPLSHYSRAHLVLEAQREARRIVSPSAVSRH
jgi:hypothetical protein